MNEEIEYNTRRTAERVESLVDGHANLQQHVLHHLTQLQKYAHDVSLHLRWITGLLAAILATLWFR